MRPRLNWRKCNGALGVGSELPLPAPSLADGCLRAGGRASERARQTDKESDAPSAERQRAFSGWLDRPEMEAKWSASRVASLLPVSGGWQRRAAAVQPASECSQSECLLSCKQIQQIPGFWRLLAGPRKTREMAFLISADLSNRPAQPVELSSELRETAQCQAKARACPLSSQRWALRRAGLRKSKKQSKAKRAANVARSGSSRCLACIQCFFILSPDTRGGV
ncbi:hypothetical protein L1887_42620 [Cichorium endivia]|nr:hypothetical protein L1887_42620 [Cichorium endivia]